MRHSGIIPLLSLVACSATVPTPEQCKIMAMPKAFLERCMRGEPPNDSYVGDAACWPFSPQKRMQGLWLIGLETSEFWPNLSQPSQIPAGGGKIWFESQLLDTDPALKDAAQGKETRIYKVDIEARSALCDGMFGHFGVYPRQVLVDRILVMNRLR